MKTLKDIIAEVQHGNEAAKMELYTRFLPLVHKISRSRSILFNARIWNRTCGSISGSVP